MLSKKSLFRECKSDIITLSVEQNHGFVLGYLILVHHKQISNFQANLSPHQLLVSELEYMKLR